MLGWFPHLATALRTKLISFARGSLLLYSAMLRLLTILQKKVFKTSAISLSLSIIFSFSTRWFLLILYQLFWKRFPGFQKDFFSVTFFSVILLTFWFPKKWDRNFFALNDFFSANQFCPWGIYFDALIYVSYMKALESSLLIKGHGQKQSKNSVSRSKVWFA